MSGGIFGHLGYIQVYWCMFGCVWVYCGMFRYVGGMIGVCLGILGYADIYGSIGVYCGMFWYVGVYWRILEEF